MITKGIVLAGGAGSRLAPMTQVVCKQLLPIYDKPMIYYSLSTLMLAGLREILLITTAQDLPHFQRLLGTGEKWGIALSYAVQDAPAGIPEAFIIGRDFIGNDGCALILGDNLFYAEGLTGTLSNALRQEQGATVFAYWVRDPERYGIVEFDRAGQPVRLIEKPVQTPSNYAITGLYFYDNQVVDFASRLTPSTRGELEITDLNNLYLQQGQLHIEVFGRGVAWLDTGTPDSMLDASNFIATLESRQGLKIGSPEEIALRQRFITVDQLLALAEECPGSAYGQYLARIAREYRDGMTPNPA